jgi:transcription antitermination factor NusG
MGTPARLGLDVHPGLVLPTLSCEPRWYALYTCANHEKSVSKQLEERSVESFLPLFESVRRWKDRRVRLHLPLFPGYVFVRMATAARFRVLQIPGVVRLVGFNGQPLPLPDEEIDRLKKGLASGMRAEPHPFLNVGRRVRLKSGPFQGKQGILLRRKGRLRLVLSIDAILRSLVIDVDAADVEAVLSKDTDHATHFDRGTVHHWNSSVPSVRTKAPH